MFILSSLLCGYLVAKELRIIVVIVSVKYETTSKFNLTGRL